METKRCSRCKETKPKNEFHKLRTRGDGYQNYCKICTKIKEQEWRKNNQQKIKENYKKYKNSPNWKKHLEGNRRYYRNLRLKVIESYGGKCECCNETTKEFLALDHVNGGGMKHKKETGYMGSSYYKWLENNGFPKEGFRLLCHNCNMSRGCYGYCPHEATSASIHSSQNNSP